MIEGNSWTRPFAISHQIMELRDSTLDNLTPNANCEDNFVWSLEKSGIFTVKSAWERWRNKYAIVAWKSLIWFPGHIPMFSLVVWLAIGGRLNTNDGLAKFYF